MISNSKFFNCLRENGISFFTGVPDSLLKSFCAYVADNTADKEHIIAANEGGAVALAVGYHLSTGK
ncbi:MAG: phosphonopyruvate decarboxylase, partial [Candidatus Omnitrophica bacterium]|nr:phosphonopyruvate decarboxylase [Candidatus Omnitrophota bacterium]